MRPLYCLLVALVVASCGSSTEPAVDISLEPTSNDVVGSFNLVLANGTAPPFAAFSTATQDWTLVADSVAIASDKTWVETTTYFVLNRLDNTTTTSFSVVAGSYLIANAKIGFTMTQGGTATFDGSVTGNTLTIIYTGKRFIYTK